MSTSVDHSNEQTHAHATFRTRLGVDHSNEQTHAHATFRTRLELSRFRLQPDNRIPTTLTRRTLHLCFFLLHSLGFIAILTPDVIIAVTPNVINNHCAERQDTD